MHVLLLPSWYHHADSPTLGTFFEDQALALRRSGVDARVAFVEYRSLRRFTFGRLRQSHFQYSFESENGVPTFRQHGWNPLAQTTAGGRLLARLVVRAVNEYVSRFGRPDLIHAHSALWAGYAAAHVQSQSGIPFIVTEHSSNFRTNKLSTGEATAATKVFAAASAVVTVSTPLEAIVRRMTPRSDVITIPNLVDTTFWTTPAFVRPRSPFTILAVGNLVRRKGFDSLVRAFANAFPGRNDVRLVLGGDGPQRRELEQLTDALNLRERVTLLGRLSREQIRSAMWQANVLVLPSHAETFGVVLIEAMSTGLPVIGTRCGGPEDIIDATVGTLIDVGDSAALRQALLDVVDGPEFEASVVRSVAQERFSYESVAARLNALYAKTLGIES